MWSCFSQETQTSFEAFQRTWIFWKINLFCFRHWVPKAGISACSYLDDATNFSLQGPTMIDNLISAEIPLVNSPYIREIMLKHMICALFSDDPDFRFMREGRCSKNFPNPFRSKTAFSENDNSLSYRRWSTDKGGEFEVRTKKSDVSGILKMAIANS